MAKHYREACYDPDCGICYPPIKPKNKPTLREPSGSKAERERIIALLVKRYSIHEPYVGFASEEDLRKALEP